MNAHDEAHHVYRFLDIGLPVAAFLTLFEVGDGDVGIGFAGTRVEVRTGEDSSSGVLCAGEEIDDLRLLGVDSLLLVLLIGDAGTLEQFLPVLVLNGDDVLERGGILELGVLTDGDELLDVVPLALEEGSVVRNRVIGAVRSREARHHGELHFAFLLALGFLHILLQVIQRVIRIEQHKALHLLRRIRIPPLTVEHILPCGVLGTEPAVHRLQAIDRSDGVAFLVEGEEGDGEVPVLHVGAHAEVERGEVVMQHEALHTVSYLVGGILRQGVLQTGGIAVLDVMLHAGIDGLVLLYLVEDFEGDVVPDSPRHIFQTVLELGRFDAFSSRVLLEHFLCGRRERGSQSALVNFELVKFDR